MAPPRLRALQPAPSSPSSTASPSLPAGHQPLPTTARKAGYVPACEPCRKRKKKCDRSRPECYKCTERGLECVYLDTAVASPNSASQLERLAHLNGDSSATLHLLTTLPYFDALELFIMLRELPQARETSITSTEASNPFSNPSASPQPSQYNRIRSLLPTSNPMEQELMVQHPIVYPIFVPMALGLEGLLTSRRPGMTATQVLNNTASPDIMLMDDEDLGEKDALFKFCKGLPHLAQLHIDYLQKFDITSWMELPVPNQTAIRAIALYLNNDYPVLPIFHEDLFLRDLSQKRPMISLHFHQVEVETAPGIMMPGDIDNVLAAEEDESNTPAPHENVFKASCKLWMIFTPVARSYYTQGINVSDGIASLDYAEKIRYVFDWRRLDSIVSWERKAARWWRAGFLTWSSQ
ncbi:hypothetical protein KAF25_006925 [Fusarium avenaceum]|uniref:Zn(2)-C6 fungal-type domain-containing protein n=1 Tax=Fusarium avenaceum TaxID=40199 RepID=A0A9P7KQ83_9HYPO|nr:hypothetical protein KAF25_006925 [Fusarium avenaceum]